MSRLIFLNVIAAVCLTGSTATASAETIQRGFQDTTVKPGLSLPLSVRFAKDGTTFIGEKSGAVKRFSAPDKTDEPSVLVADLRKFVDSWGDRGLLGLAVDPDYGPQRPFIYVSYTYSEQRGDASDCATPNEGCAASGRVSRIDTSKRPTDGEGNPTNETVLVEDYCVQYNSHTVGDLAFGPDGSLYASAGEGASTAFADRGQVGDPCNDPGGEGGAFRSQDLATGGDPLGLSGTIVRLDPNAPGKLTSAQYSDRIVSYGHRNPFRIDFRPGTNEIWAADVGWNDWEEINRVIPGERRNFGWPCYEGPGRQASYAGFNSPICSDLYVRGDAVAPTIAYQRQAPLFPGDRCPVGRRSSLAALQFYDGAAFPPEYRGALFFSEYMRGCTWAVPPGPDGVPDLGRAVTFSTGLKTTDLQVGPKGDLYYTTIERANGRGDLRRVRWIGKAQFTATPMRGPMPLDVRVDAGATSMLDGPVRFEWDLDNDGQFDDGTGAQLTHRFANPGDYTIRIRATNATGFQDIETQTIRVDGPPSAQIETPREGYLWETGEAIEFRGFAVSGADGSRVPASGLAWQLHRCDLSKCSQLRSWKGVAKESFIGPKATNKPSWLVLRLTATETNGLSHTVQRRLDPKPGTPRSRLQLQGAKLLKNGTLRFDGKNDTATYAASGLNLSKGFTISARVKMARRSRTPASLFIGELSGAKQAFRLDVKRTGKSTRWNSRMRAAMRVNAGKTTRISLSWNGRSARVKVGKKVIRRTYKGRALRKIKAQLLKVKQVRIGGVRGNRRWYRGDISRLAITEKR